jgi:cell division protein FtsQ
VTAVPPAPPTMAPPTGPSRLPIDPRIRQRRIEVRREEGRRRLKFLCTLLAVAVLAATGIGITHSWLLAVHHVEVSGTAHISRAEVIAAAGVRDGDLMVDIHPGRLASRLDGLPWVASAAVSRHWPTTVQIRITERVPVALIPSQPGQVAVVDGTGRVLAVGPAPGGPPALPVSDPAGAGAAAGRRLPTIVGLDPAGGPGSSLADDGRLQGALALIAALAANGPPSLRDRISTVSVAPDGQLSATLAPAITLRLGPSEQLEAKLLALGALVQQVDLKGVTSIDVRVPDSPVLTRAGRAGTVSTTSRG